MNGKIDNEKLPDAPNVSCPEKIESPFLEAANSISDDYYSYDCPDFRNLKKILLNVDELISQQRVEELRQAGEKLRQEAESIAPRRNSKCNVSDSYFCFKDHTVPFIGEATEEDIALYSIITGKLEGQIPLRIAQFFIDDDSDWEFSLSEIRNVGKIIPAIPETIIKLPQIRVDEKRRLIIGGWNSNSAIELVVNWRERGHPICKAVRKSNDDKLWSKESVQADLVRCNDKYVWLSMEEPSKATLLCPGLIQLKDYFEEVGECLKLWRKNLGKPDDFSVRLKKWRESKPNAAPWIAHIAEVILANFSPWPDPFHLRAENDSERDWSPEQSLKQVLPLFRAFARAPLRITPPNLVKTFLYLIRRPNVDAHAYAGEFSDMWNFSVRTYDHSWINGEIIGNPTLGANSPLKFEEIGSGYGGAEGYCISCAGIDCFISEERNQRR